MPTARGPKNRPPCTTLDAPSKMIFLGAYVIVLAFSVFGRLKLETRGIDLRTRIGPIRNCSDVDQFVHNVVTHRPSLRLFENGEKSFGENLCNVPHGCVFRRVCIFDFVCSCFRARVRIFMTRFSSELWNPRPIEGVCLFSEEPSCYLRNLRDERPTVNTASQYSGLTSTRHTYVIVDVTSHPFSDT